MNGVEVIPMGKSHLDAAADLEKACFSQPWSRRGLEEELENPLAFFYIALLDGKTAGYAGMHCVAGEAYVTNVAVFPQFRRRGAGRALTEKLVATAEREGCSFLSLEVRASNGVAISLYQSLGFQEEGRRKHFYASPQEDAVIMTRRFPAEQVKGGLTNGRSKKGE